MKIENHTALIFLSFLYIGIQNVATEKLLAKEQFFGNKWPINFKGNSQTLPSIEVKLIPPNDPLPQVLAEIKLLDHARMRMEEGLMAKFEDEYNKQLDNAQTEIENTIDQAMRIFDDPNILTSTVRGALLPITNKRKAAKTAKGSFVPKSAMYQVIKKEENNSPFFRQLNKNEVEIETTETRKPVKEHTNALANGPIDLSIIKQQKIMNTSLLEIKSSTKNSAISNQKAVSELESPPTLQIQVDDIKAPDIKIKAKMDEIEQKRADEEAKMIEQAVGELGQLLKITLIELEKNIQIQLNPFLVDTAIVTQKVEQELPKRGIISKLLSFREVTKDNFNKKCLEKKQKYSHLKLDCDFQPKKYTKVFPSSFLQVAEANKVISKNLFGGSKQLNVRVGQSDKPYPTIDELFNDAQKKRDATERLERMKILQLDLKFLKAINQMIKEKLRLSLARVLAQLGPVVETIKTEIAAENLN